MGCSKELNSIVNHRISEQDVKYLTVDCFSRRCRVSCRNACYKTDVVIDERLAAQCELTTICLQFSGRQFSILEYVMLQFSVFRNLFELTNRSSDIIVIVCLEVLQAAFLCEFIESHGCFSVAFLICFLDCVIENCRECCCRIVESSLHYHVEDFLIGSSVQSWY